MRKLKNSELNRLSIADYQQTTKTPIVVVLDNIRSLNNIGSTFRTSDAFCIEKIALCGITATPPNKDIHKTALGAEDAVKWNYYSSTLDAINELKKQDYIICTIEQVEGSTSLENFLPKDDCKYAVVFGNEVKGVDQKVINESDFCLEIPQYGIV